jgi:hypothetical protein
MSRITEEQARELRDAVSRRMLVHDEYEALLSLLDEREKLREEVRDFDRALRETTKERIFAENDSMKLRREIATFVSALCDYEFKCGKDHAGVFEIVDTFTERIATLDRDAKATQGGER